MSDVGASGVTTTKELQGAVNDPSCRENAAESTSSPRSSAAPVVSEEVCQSIKKGMRIISDIEQTRADGMVFKFELDLMYEVKCCTSQVLRCFDAVDISSCLFDLNPRVLLLGLPCRLASVCVSTALTCHDRIANWRRCRCSRSTLDRLAKLTELLTTVSPLCPNPALQFKETQANDKMCVVLCQSRTFPPQAFGCVQVAPSWSLARTSRAEPMQIPELVGTVKVKCTHVTIDSGHEREHFMHTNTIYPLKMFLRTVG